MTSTGNDIVALKAIDIARTKQYRFYTKILSPTEKDLYDRELQGKIPFENFVWLLWSIKESAYKYLQRITPDLVFSPTKTVIEKMALPEQLLSKKFQTQTEGRGLYDDDVYKGIVTCGTYKLYYRSIINEDLIFSVVNCEDDFENTCWGIQMIPSNEPAFQSKAVREFLSARLNGLFPGDNLQISKSVHGYPILLRNGAKIRIPVSLAHHDHFVAYAFQLNTN